MSLGNRPQHRVSAASLASQAIPAMSMLMPASPLFFPMLVLAAATVAFLITRLATALAMIELRFARYVDTASCSILASDAVGPIVFPLIRIPTESTSDEGTAMSGIFIGATVGGSL